MTELATVPVPAASSAGSALARLQEVIGQGMAPALAIMLDEQLFNQAARIAKVMAGAKGFVPKHCEGNTEVCFAVTTRALVWQLDPFAVAQSTYQPVPGAKVSYEAKLVQAIIEQSRRLEGPIKASYRGEWSKIQGKFIMRESSKTDDNGNKKKYAASAWKEEDEEGIGITLTAKLKGDAEPRTVDLDLRQCYPRNSTLWATDPKTQIYYRAIRMFGNVACPSLLMGVPFVGEEPDEQEHRGPEKAKDITPASRAPVERVELVDRYGEAFAINRDRVEAWIAEQAKEATEQELAEFAEANQDSAEVQQAVDDERARRNKANAKKATPQSEPAQEDQEAETVEFKRPGNGQSLFLEPMRAMERLVEEARKAPSKATAAQLLKLNAAIVERLPASTRAELQALANGQGGGLL